MVAQKIICPSRGDDIGFESNNTNQRYGFFENESQDSQYFESGRDRSFKARKEAGTRRLDRSNPQRKYRAQSAIAPAHHKLCRGKIGLCHDFLKSEPLQESMMYSSSDFEFFRDLAPWCSTAAGDEAAQIIDSNKTFDERASNTDTPYTPISPQGWDGSDATSPLMQTGFYPTLPETHFSLKDIPDLERDLVNEQFADITEMPVVYGDVGSDYVISTTAWPDQEVGWTYAQDPFTSTNTHIMPFINEEDSLDTKTCVKPGDVENADVIMEYIVEDLKPGVKKDSSNKGLTMDIRSRPQFNPIDDINTPEVLSFVEQLEKENSFLPSSTTTTQWSHTAVSSESIMTPLSTPPMTPVTPITPMTESHLESEEEIQPCNKRRRHNSAESDESYTPYADIKVPTRKYKRKRMNIPIKEMIQKLEGSQPLTKARRGRPPKRRDSNVSSVCSVDDTSSNVSTHENKYRELRDKNNEASKRSRMNRKLKELQMEQMAMDLEEKNYKLRIDVQLLEGRVKMLKDALMTAVLKTIKTETGQHKIT